ncbi:MAG: hypothetical protein HYV63_05235 [Candidatus Schekmanbacteria bacterium]|nr:hypothetical protein [Candidatus Schekmanbacteria bacterium]
MSPITNKIRAFAKKSASVLALTAVMSTANAGAGDLTAMLDVSQLGKVPVQSLSAQSLGFDHATRLAPSRVAAALGEALVVTDARSSGRVRGEMSRFTFESAPQRGLLLLQAKPGADLARGVKAIPASAKDLPAKAKKLLASLGIPASEVGTVTEKAVMRASRLPGDAAGELQATVHAQKVFVERQVNGLPVLGSQAVVTFDQSGNLKKLIMRWPALAASGHQLTSRLSASRIAQRVAGDAVLTERANGFVGKVPVRLAYDPEEGAGGRLTLKLVAAAALVPDADGGEKISVYNVAIDE